MTVTAHAVRSLLLFLPLATAGAQNASVPPAAASTSAAVSSSLLQPSLGDLQRSLGSLDPDRWKLARQLRDDTRRNMDSVRRDINETLPGLMTSGDAMPHSVSAELALMRNVDALYDVALRIAATAEIAGPAQQSAALEQALADLLQARRALGDRVAADAAAQQAKVGELQAALQSTAVVTPPACPTTAGAAAAEKSKAKRPRPRPKPVPAVPTPPPTP